MLVAEKINPILFTLAREARELSQQELADQLGCSQSSIMRLESGELEIKPEVFSKMQKVLDFPKEFFMQEGTMVNRSFYRKRDKVSQGVLNKIDTHINIYRLGVDRFLKMVNFPVAKLPSFDFEGTLAPVEYARALRKYWKLPKGPIENLTNVLEEHGIMVITFDFETERVDGRSIVTESGYPLIIVNRTLLGDRLRFTLAYELGHLIMHAFSKKIKFNTDASHEANVFAAEFLTDEKGILPDFKETVTIAKLIELKLKWKVSMQSLLYRACDLEKVSAGQKKYLLEKFNQLKIRRREPPELDLVKESPRLLRDLITKYKTKQRLTVKETAKIFGLNQEEFLKRYS